MADLDDIVEYSEQEAADERQALGSMQFAGFLNQLKPTGRGSAHDDVHYRSSLEHVAMPDITELDMKGNI
jgi:hypothetical protein